jgi:hypothetical protein
MPNSSTDDLVNEDMRIARMRAIQRWYRERLEDDYYPFCHIPDLFEIDPNAERPYAVPKSFIPEDVGGNVQVIEADDEELLATETLNQMLGSFLPGGFKQRWEFQVFRLNTDVSDADRKTDIQPGFSFDDAVELADVLGPGKQEQYTPFEYSTDDVTLYFPQEMFVESVQEDPSYWWDDVNYAVWTSEPMVSAENRYRLGQSDPTANYLWFKHLDPEQDIHEVETHDLSEATDGIANQLGYCAEATVLRCYYASLLTLYEKDHNETISRIIEYHHDEDGRDAFVTSREQSQALLFNFVRAELRERLQEALSDPHLRRDLQFAFLYRRLWDDLFVTADDGVEHVFAVDPLHQTLQAVDYWHYRLESPQKSLFELEVSSIIDALDSLLPGETDGSTRHRLHLMGIDDQRRDEFKSLLATNRSQLKSILSDCQSEDELLDFGEDVLLHSLTHAVSAWAVQDSAGGASFERWYDVNFQERDREYAKVAVYDSIQGGAGISRELYDWFIQQPEIDLRNKLTTQAHCYTATAEETTIDLLQSHSGEFLFELYNSDREEFATFFAEWYDQPDSPLERDDVTTMVLRRLNTLFETRDLARFYDTVAHVYLTVATALDRTPRTVDLLLALEDHTFRDSRVAQTYEQYANRDSRRRDLSEIAERIGELSKQCIYACPDCLKTDESDCVHGMRYQEQMLNKNLLKAVLEGAD